MNDRRCRDQQQKGLGAQSRHDKAHDQAEYPIAAEDRRQQPEGQLRKGQPKHHRAPTPDARCDKASLHRDLRAGDATVAARAAMQLRMISNPTAPSATRTINSAPVVSPNMAVNA